MAKKITTQTAPTFEPRTPYFVYGSLMSSKVLLSIIGRSDAGASEPLTQKALRANQMSRATLYGHKRYVVNYADYPAILNTGKPEDLVEGYLVSGLTAAQEAKIKIYESGLYTDEEAEVVMGWGEEVKEMEVRKARVYVWGGKESDLVDPEVREWSFEKFKKSRMYLWGRTLESDEED